MIASLLLSACLLAAPTTDQPSAPAATPKAATTSQKAATPKAPAEATPAAAPKGASGPTTPAGEAPKGLVVVETSRGKLEFSHKEHASTACAKCHKGQAVPARIGVKGLDAAHKFCVDCHKAEKKGPEKCSWCHTKP